MNRKFQIVKNFKIFGIISVLLCATGLVALLGLPFGFNLFNFTIDFVGGTEMEFNMKQPVSSDLENQVASIFQEVTGVSGAWLFFTSYAVHGLTLVGLCGRLCVVARS